jgi:hypothetical protein
MTEFFREHGEQEFNTPDGVWRAFVDFQNAQLIRITGKTKYHLELTASQHAAMIGLIGEVMSCACPHAEEFTDCMGPEAIKTTPGDLLTMVMNARYQGG